MNKAHSIQGYRSAAFAVPMEYDERSSTDSSGTSGVVVLSGDRFDTIGLLARIVSEGADISSGISKRSVLNRSIAGGGRRQSIRERKGPARVELNQEEKQQIMSNNRDRLIR